MDKQIRNMDLVFVACFGVLFLQVNNLQIREAGALRRSRYEPTSDTDLLTQNRGVILSGDGVVLAKSAQKRDADEQRVNPQDSLFADVIGYDDVVDEAETGLEAEYNHDLVPHESPVKNIPELLTQRSGPDTTMTTISAALHNDARAALHNLTGAVVVLDPKTGAVLAIYSDPTFNPNLLAAHDAPTVDRAYSLFLMHNYDDELCGGCLAENLAVSCDTASGLYGLELGATVLTEEAHAFGFDAVPPLDLPEGEVSASSFPPGPTFATNLPGLAYSAIGQENVNETALEDALVAAAIADNGTMTPHLLSAMVNVDGMIVNRYRPRPWRRATSSATAKSVRQLMLGVTELTDGIGAGLFSPNLSVAAKTGTAQTTPNSCLDAWFVAFAPASTAETPQVAVAVTVPAQTGVACQDIGATAAGPIARNVLLDALKLEL